MFRTTYRQLRYNLDPFRTRKPRQPALRMRLEVSSKLMVPAFPDFGMLWVENDKGHRPLAPLDMRTGNDADLENVRMAGELLLDCQARGILTTGDDNVLAPVHDGDGAVGVYHCEVS